MTASTLTPSAIQHKSAPAKRLFAKRPPAPADPGWIEGYAAVFGNVDGQGERIVAGAFAKTVAERVSAGKVKLMIVHLAHGGDCREVIGTVTRCREDEYGLWIHADLSSAPIAQETRLKVIEGHVSGLSIGYVPVRWRETSEQGRTIRELIEVMLLEVTVTTVPANELARVTEAKALSSAPASPAEREQRLGLGERAAEHDRQIVVRRAWLSFYRRRCS